jgi:hypothetical protein
MLQTEIETRYSFLWIHVTEKILTTVGKRDRVESEEGNALEWVKA